MNDIVQRIDEAVHPQRTFGRMTAQLEDQIVLFLDFLGFSEASVQADVDTQNRLLQLLHAIASLRANYSLEVKPLENGHSYRIQPAISTFSDHIVLSFPLENLRLNNIGAPDIVIHQLIGVVSWVAREALARGFLVRGGVSVGKLYHSDGVVFGPAMVQAHDLESRISIYPRVVLSSALTHDLRLERRGLFLRQDTDGLVSIDYFRDMILRSSQPGDDYPAQISAWFDQALGTVKGKIEELSGSKQLNARGKWVWFAGRMHETLEKYAAIFDI